MAGLIGIIVPIRKLLSKSKQSIGVGGKELIELGENRVYSIPVFQREIRWDENNVSQLIDDLRNGKQFLGNIILTQHSSTEYSIIDGQQRLTIITMIIHCIMRLHGTRIDVMEPCVLNVESFDVFNDLINEGFSDDAVSPEIIEQSDKLKQAEKYSSLWKYILKHPIISNQKEATILLENIENSEVNLIINQSDNIRESIRYFIDVNLKGKQLDPEDIFKSYLFKNDSSDDIRKEWYRFKKNVVLAKTRNIQYPLLKYIEHFFYCDLYKDSKYKGLEFSDEFRLKKEFKTKEEYPQSFRKNSHLIEIIANNYYMLNSFRRLNNVIETMIEIAGTDGPSDCFKKWFPCVNRKKAKTSLDSNEFAIIHNIMKKILRDSHLLPKALLMKYILSVIDKQPKGKEEYRKIYGVYLLTVLFVVFENKKSKDVLFSVLKSDDESWYDEAISQIKSYFSTDGITDSRLLAQYKLGVNEDDEDYRFRCKSLATIYNYFRIKNNCVDVTNYDQLKEFVGNENEYSMEHFIISETKTRLVVVSINDAMVEYKYNEKFFKRYVNSMFNLIFVSKKINTELGNNWLPAKEEIIQNKPEIKCDYSKMVISISEDLSNKLRSLSLGIDNYQDKLDLFFSRDFKDLYIEYSRKVLEAVINRIKTA